MIKDETNTGQLKPVEMLLHNLSDRSYIERLYDHAKQAKQDFPRGMNTFIIQQFLYHAGIEVPYKPSRDVFIAHLIASGCRIIPRDLNPQPGDLFVCLTKNLFVIHIGIVAKVHNLKAQPEITLRDFFKAADEYMEESDYRPYRRPFEENEDCFGVGYWIRLYS
jgi:hypothetical protein